mmetsp:Transcript_21384/g.33548  ORF Transcript_21384/g.33548 Transcript_21384/m.33548 type:complete len:234 (+) Transcript_21384:75-776(+)
MSGWCPSPASPLRSRRIELVSRHLWGRAWAVPTRRGCTHSMMGLSEPHWRPTPSRVLVASKRSPMVTPTPPPPRSPARLSTKPPNRSAPVLTSSHAPSPPASPMPSPKNLPAVASSRPRTDTPSTPSTMWLTTESTSSTSTSTRGNPPTSLSKQVLSRKGRWSGTPTKVSCWRSPRVRGWVRMARSIRGVMMVSSSDWPMGLRRLLSSTLTMSLLSCSAMALTRSSIPPSRRM